MDESILDVVSAHPFTLVRRLEMALRSGGMGTFVWDIARDVADYDDSLQQMLGFAPGEFTGSHAQVAERVHPDDRASLLEIIQDVLEGRATSYEHVHRAVLPDGRVRVLRSWGQMFDADNPSDRRLVGVVRDITDQAEADSVRDAAVAEREAAKEAASLSQRRLLLLAQAAHLLEAPLDVEVTLQEVADLAVTMVADWCVVDLQRDDEQPRIVAVAHRDPAMVQLARDSQEQYPPNPNDPVRRSILENLETAYYPQVSDDLLVAGARDEAHLKLMRMLEMSSVIAAPLRSSGKASGVLLFIATHGRSFSLDDVELAKELGRQAGSAVERALQYEERDTVARALQRSLLPPELPQLPGVSLHAHYEPADRGNDIGGDFYDVFETEPGLWWLVLGDVAGKGAEAAALTGATRYMLRALALHSTGPADALQKVNDALYREDWQGRFATAVVACFELPQQSGEGIDLRVVLAGHPAPLLHRTDNAVIETIGEPGSLLGLFDDTDLVETTVKLSAGDTLLLYTDGATDGKTTTDGTERFGETGLHRVFAQAATQPSADTPVVKRIAEGIRRETTGRRDDLALLSMSIT